MKKYLMNYEFNTSYLAERRVFLAHYQTITYSQTLYRTNNFHFPSHGKPFSLHLTYPPSEDEMEDIDNGPRTSESDNELDDSYNSDVNVKKDLRYLAVERDVDDILFEMGNRTYPSYILFQFELVKIMSPCITWILNIHDLHVNESNYLSHSLSVKYVSMNCERSSTDLIIALTNIP
ncbi:hypothetical protein Cgig2_009702 [Carnegiea gigantea]|uniref:Uncharacterized protein n=1 Tax=Carnegiea gigantea TaxID=171969 RepID=A0A9Q1GT41_9CARY|nr:hypothetical protein Cgig2_009702 [Carnegiea gigantea]